MGRTSVASGAQAAVPGLICSERPTDQISYARDMWPRHHLAVRGGQVAEHRPAAIAWPENTDQLTKLIAWCAQQGVSVVPYGAGSGVCGGVLPARDALIVDVKRMKRWRHFSPDEGVIEVEAGALGIRLEEDLNAKGYTIGHFPSSILCSTAGGWVAARGAGQCSGLYGKIEDMVAALECVDGRGEIAMLHRRARGPDLTPILIGSEGILALISAVRFRLHRVPAHRAFGALGFETLAEGCEAIRMIYQQGLRPSVCRLYDPFDSMMARHSRQNAASDSTIGFGGSKNKGHASGVHGFAIRHALRFPSAINSVIDKVGSRFFGGCTLILVFEGNKACATGQLAEARSIGAMAGARDLGKAPAQHWFKHRYSVSYRQAPMFMMGAFVDTMEVAATWSNLDSLYRNVQAALRDHVMVMAHLSHAYPDGCSIYFTFAGSARNTAAAERRYEAAWKSGIAAAIASGGTLSHHHGVGRSKAPQMGAEIGLGVAITAALKRAFDPNAILNPGNLIPEKTPPPIALPEAPPAPELDEKSQLVFTSAAATLAEVETRLATRGWTLSLGHEAPDLAQCSVREWIADGMPGAPDAWLDPVDHVVAGYSVELPQGAPLVIRACPRRAVGPDLFALFHGAKSRTGRIHTATLRARSREAEPLHTPIDRQPTIGDVEATWIERAFASIDDLS